jgi:hypothetical protein
MMSQDIQALVISQMEPQKAQIIGSIIRHKMYFRKWHHIADAVSEECGQKLTVKACQVPFYQLQAKIKKRTAAVMAPSAAVQVGNRQVTSFPSFHPYPFPLLLCLL